MPTRIETRERMKYISWLTPPIELEQELKTSLHNSRQSGAGHTTECAGIDFAARVLKLRVIQKVECLKAKLQFFFFGHFQALQQCHVEIIQSGTMKEPATSISELTE